ILFQSAHLFPPFFKNYSKRKEGKIDFKKKTMKRAVFITGLKSRVFNGNFLNKKSYPNEWMLFNNRSSF
ncbi:hypothetical protein, partial [Lactobacillus intestinalis]|uniref:hypothetical protein n=1 Tax=Lactobacillus intestinalis TaxID=151781 RepID=UPI0025A1DE91